MYLSWQLPKIPARILYRDAAALEKAVNRYFKRCYSKVYEKITEDGVKSIVGMVDIQGRAIYKMVEQPSILKMLQAIGMDKKEYNRCMAGTLGQEQQDVMESATVLIEGDYVNMLVAGEGDSSGLKFILTSTFGYKDEKSVKVEGDLKYSNMTDAELKTKMDEIEQNIVEGALDDEEK